jgi:hypothetical protein
MKVGRNRSGRKKGAGFKDIPVGTRFGNYTVIGPCNEVRPNGAHCFPCRCDCGREKTIIGAHLRSGTTRSCKRCSTEANAAKRFPNLIGKTRGKWRIIARIPREERPDCNNAWLAECECGTKKAMGATEFYRKTSISSCRACFDRSTPHHYLRPYQSMYNSLKNFKSKEHEVTISYEDLLSAIETGKCHYCWTPLTWKERRGHSSQLDRKDNAAGYIPGNIVACCKRCNYAKCDVFTYEQWFTMTECYRDGRLAYPTVKISSTGSLGARNL